MTEATQEELQTRLVELETLYQINNALNNTTNVNGLLRVVIHALSNTEMFFAFLQYIDQDEGGEPDTGTVMAVWSRGGEPLVEVGMQFPLKEMSSPSLWINSPDEALLIENTAEDERLDKATCEMMQQFNAQAMVIIPLYQSGRWIGLVNLHWDKPHIFSTYEQAICRALPTLLTPLVENRRLVDQMQSQAARRIRENDQQQQAILDNMYQLIALLKPDGRLVQINRIAREIAGLSADFDVSTLYLWEIPLWPDSETIQTQLQQAVAQAAANKFVRYAVEANAFNSIITLDFSLKPIFDDERQVTLLVAEGRDITQMKQAQEESQRFKLMADNAVDGIFTCDAELNFIYANRSTYELLGYDFETRELIGQSSATLWLEDDHPKLQAEVIPAIFSTGWRGTVSQVRKDGSIFEVDATAMSIQGPGGEATDFMVIIRDITEMKRTQADMKIFRAIAENSTQGVSMASLEGHHIYGNAAYLNMLGVTDPGTEFYNKPLINFFPAEVHEQVAEQTRSIMENGQTSVEIPMQRIDGTTFPALQLLFLIYDDAGNPLCMAISTIDLTEQKKAEAERNRLQQEVIDAQKQALQELSTPIIPIMDGIIIMPLIGTIDTVRSRDIMRALLSGISQHRAKVVILDITGVPIVDSGVADHLDKTMQAARLKGAQTIITGISDAVAETIVDLGIDWRNIETLRDLQTGLIEGLSRLGIQIEQRKTNGKRN